MRDYNELERRNKERRKHGIEAKNENVFEKSSR